MSNENFDFLFVIKGIFFTLLIIGAMIIGSMIIIVATFFIVSGIQDFVYDGFTDKGEFDKKNKKQKK